MHRFGVMTAAATLSGRTQNVLNVSLQHKYTKPCKKVVTKIHIRI
jgi:hypothetical protein